MSASENKISRRRFLRLSSSTVLAALCTGCLKRTDSQTDTETSVTAVPADAAQVDQPASSITRCPRRRVNDPYPGRCQHYLDQDGDGYCDFSTQAN